jgi:hypothetical protein
MIVLLSVIWTSHVASGIKAAVTVTVVLLALLGGIGQLVHALVKAGYSWEDDGSSVTRRSRSLRRRRSHRSLVSDYVE